MRWGERWGGRWGGEDTARRRGVDACDRLQRKIRRGVNARALATIIGERYGAHAEAIREVLHAITNTGAASGPFLDAIGRLVGLARQGDGDSRFRRALLVWQRCRGSRGTTNEILEVVRAWLGSGPSVSITPAYPMGFRLEISDLPTEDLARLILFVGKAKAATYGAAIAVTSTTTPLLCDVIGDPVTDARTCDVVEEDVDSAGTLVTLFDA